MKMQDTMQRAMRLMQLGDLRAATDAIQQGLAAKNPESAPKDGSGAAFNADTSSSAGSVPDYIDVEFCVIDADPVTDVPPRGERADTGAPRSRGVREGSDEAFKPHHFTCDAGELDYKLYIPPGLDTVRAPLLLMLHGCTQNPDDFARGTRMNELAREFGYVVAYPAQSSQRNPNRCWNWFQPGDQQRGRGEPEILAALTKNLLHRYSLDESRVYVAGLSAGGAMATVLASTYPEIYAAIGVHSGLPVGRARDVASAFAAMRNSGAVGPTERQAAAAHVVPTIVFHGDRDTTVHPSNGEEIVAHVVGRAEDVDVVSRRGTSKGGRGYSCTLHRRKDGSVAAEHWVIEGAGHAWAGGDRSGSYTDPSGPDASREMLRFFSDSVKAKRTSDRSMA